MTAYKLSDANLVRRVPKSEDAPHGIVPADSIPVNTPCIVAFGGELTEKPQHANAYASALNKLMIENNIKDIDVYSVMYQFGSRDSKMERAELFRAAGRRISAPEHPITRAAYEKQLQEINKNEPVPNYISKLFDIILRPRFSDAAGDRLPTDEVLKRARKIKFYTHCHGAATVYQMANMMHDEMRRMGYLPRDIANIQKNILVIQHSPLGPLTNLRFTTLSFASAEDTMLQNHGNKFAQWIYDNSADIIPSFFEEPNGNIFVAGHLKEASFQEHDFRGLLKSDEDLWPLTEDGKIIFAAERNAIVNGARHSVHGGPLPSVSELVDGDGVDFEAMKHNGDFFFNFMLAELRQQNPKRGHQK